MSEHKYLIAYPGSFVVYNTQEEALAAWETGGTMVYRLVPVADVRPPPLSAPKEVA